MNAFNLNIRSYKRELDGKISKLELESGEVLESSGSTPVTTDWNVFSSLPVYKTYEGRSTILIDENGNILDTITSVDEIHTVVHFSGGGNALVYTKASSNPFAFNGMQWYTNCRFSIEIEDEELHIAYGEDYLFTDTRSLAYGEYTSLSELLINNRGS